MNPSRTKPPPSLARRAARSLALLLGTALALLVALPVHADPFLRHQVNVRGDFVLLGNMLGIDCGKVGGLPLVDPVKGTVGACGTNTPDSSADVFWTTDGLTARADVSVPLADAKSQAMLVLPANARVTYARLYWAGSRQATSTSTFPPDTTVTLSRAGASGFSNTVTSDGGNTSKYLTNVDAYQSTADVTRLVQTHGAGPYIIGGVDTQPFPGLGNNESFSAWWMVVFYEQPGMPLRQLTVFDSLDLVKGASSTPASESTTTLKGFLVPPTEGYQAKMGIVAFEGDRDLIDDQLLFNGNVLQSGPATSPINHPRNFFNGTRDFMGAVVSNEGDLPQSTGTPGSLTGLDLDVMNVRTYVKQGDTQAGLRATSSGDVIWLGGFITSISTQSPSFSDTVKTVRNLTRNDGSTRAGDVLEYTVTTRNSGEDASVQTVLKDVLPSSVTYVPGSLQVTSGANVGPKTDAVGDDQGEFVLGSPSTLLVRLGTGANGTQGGGMAINESATVVFQVRVNAGASGRIDNQAFVTAAGFLGTHTTTVASSPSSGATRTPTTVTVGLPAPIITAPGANETLPDNMPTYMGTAEPGTTVTVTVDGNFLCAVTANLQTGAWSCAGVTPLADGPHNVSASAMDSGGTSSPTTTVPFIVDTTPPVAPTIATPAHGSTTNDTTPDFTGSAPGATSVTLVLDGVTYGPIPVTNGAWSFPSPVNLGQGSHTVTVTAKDAVGNVSAPTSSTFTVDIAPPNTTIHEAPESLTKATTAHFTFSADKAGSTFQCSLDNGPWVACSSPTDFSGLGHGPHTLQVLATDALGNVELEPASYSWTVDLQAPAAPAITSPEPNDVLTTNTPTYTGTAEPGSSVTVTVDNNFVCTVTAHFLTGAWSCASVTPLSEGAHTVSATATDTAGNPGSATSVPFSVDTVKPEAPVIATPANGSTTSDTTPVYSGSAEPNSKLTLVIDGVAYGPITVGDNGQWSFPAPTELKGGQHTVTATTVDAAGNVSPQASSTFTVDAAPPNTTIHEAPELLTNATTAHFTFSADKAGSTFQCSLDNGPWVACSSPTDFSGLGHGAHTLQVLATDTLGNVELEAASYSWTVDLEAPGLPTIATPADGSTINDITPDFTGTAPGATTVTLVLDGVTYGPIPVTDGKWSFPSPVDLSAGPHTVTVTSQDGAGNKSEPVSSTFTVDTTPPNTTIHEAPALLTNATTAHFTFTADKAGSTFQCKLDNGPWMDCSSPRDFSSLGHGPHTLQVLATDLAGNVELEAATYSWTVDLEPPGLPTIATPADGSTTNDTTPDFTGTAPGATSVTLVLDGVTYGPIPVTDGTWSFPSPVELGQGPHTVTVTSQDGAGNKSEPVSSTFTVDTTPPNTTLHETPESLTKASTAHFTFTADKAGSTFQCKLDDGPWEPCSSAHELSGLGHGPHTLQVLATDPAGNVELEAASYSWTVDLEAPLPPVIASPANGSHTNDATPDYSGTAEPNSKLTLVIDGVAYGPITVGDNGQWVFPAPTELEGGQHTVTASTVDAAGNVSPETSSLFTVDSSRPNTTIHEAPAPLTNATTAHFTFTADKAGSTFECKLDNGPWVDCSSPANFFGLGQGSHTLQVRATDPLGNVELEPASYSWTVDLEYPKPPEITSPKPNAVLTTNTPTYTGTAEPGLTVTVTVDNLFLCTTTADALTGVWSCDTVVPLKEGAHSVSASTTDAAGNTSHATPVPFIVDTMKPEAPVIATPANGTTISDTTPVYSGSAEPNTQLTLVIDGVAYGPIAVGTDGLWSFPAPKELEGGPHTVTARTLDAAGNLSPEASSTFTVDSTRPNTTIEEKPELLTRATTAHFTFSADKAGSTFECKLDEGDWEPCSSPMDYSNLGHGPHTFQVRATDLLGNKELEPASYSWTVDLQAPVAPAITSPKPNEVLTTNVPTYTGTAEAGSSVTVTVDNIFLCTTTADALTGAWSCNSLVPLQEGAHSVSATATDAAGHTSAATAVPFIVDTLRPEAPVIATPANGSRTNDTTPLFSGTAEPNSQLTLVIDGVSYGPIAVNSLGGWSFPSPIELGAGPHTVTATTKDAAGHISPEASSTFTVDLTPPNTTIEEKPAQLTSATVAHFTFTADEPSTFECKLDNGAWEPCTSPRDLSNLADGSHTLLVRATDLAGNLELEPASYTWTVDTTAPVAPTIATPAHGSRTNDTTPDFRGTGEPNTQLTLVLDGKTYGPIPVGTDGTWSFPAPVELAAGAHTVTVTTTDAAGNVSAPASSTFTVDRTAPDTFIVGKPESLTRDTVAAFNFDSDESPVTYRCNLDGKGWEPCTDPDTFTGLADGKHTLQVVAIDAAGNEDASPASYEWTVDTKAPVAPVITSPTRDERLSTNTTTYTGTAEPHALVTVTVDGQVVGTVRADASGNWSLPSGTLSEGPHTISATATDAAGNVSSAASVPFFVDTHPVAPDTDNDGLTDALEAQLGTDPNDDDTDDDGLKDGSEDANRNGVIDAGETSPLDKDSDKDGLLDGTEVGLTQPEGTGTDMSIFVADADPSTHTDPLNADTDGGSVLDGIEDKNHNGRVDAGETDPLKTADDVDADGDGIDNTTEHQLGLDPFDADTDNDGVTDGRDGVTDTDGDGMMDALDPDSDNDGLKDGTESGVTLGNAPADTDTSSPNFVADSDPSTTTDPKNADTDGDGLKDGTEDKVRNGRVDSGETDPNNPDSDNGGVNDGAEAQSGGDPLATDDDFLVAGRGCSTSGSNPLPLLAALMLLALPLLRRRRQALQGRAVKAGGVVAALLAVFGVLGSSTASAQASAPTEAIDVQQYKPGPGATDVLAVHGAKVGKHLGWHLGLSLNYAHNPLGVLDPREDDFIYQIVQHQFTADLMGSISLFDRVELGVALPVTYQASQAASATAPLFSQGLSGMGVGDLRLVPKAHLLQAGGFDLGLVVPVLLPTSNRTNFLGGAGVSAQPRLVAEWHSEGGVRLLANAGVNLRPEQQLRNLRVGNELAYGVGAEVPLTQKLALQGNLHGALGLEQQDSEELPLELLAALRYRIVPGLAAHVGGGPGLTRGYGTPGFRLFAGLDWTARAERPAPVPVAPVCTLGAEDLDGFQDGDNCLDADNDADGLADGADVCPNEPETANGFRDADGCPDEALATTGTAEPLPPLAPIGDSDKDGLMDDEDRCVQQPEDVDGFEDADGCPELDNDRDGVADASDTCPLEAETINGVKDEDGCADKGASQVRLEGKRIAILGKVHFATGKDVILPKSFKLLEQVASVLRANPQLELVRVEGHTDDQGKDAMNLDLSQRRANNVRAFLINKGIAAERLEAVGYGETRPVDTNQTASGRENNRRVEFNILKVTGENPVTTEGGTP